MKSGYRPAAAGCLSAVCLPMAESPACTPLHELAVVWARLSPFLGCRLVNDCGLALAAR